MKVEKIICLIDNFEKQLENQDEQLNVFDVAMSQTTLTNAPQDAIETIMKRSAEEAGIDPNMDLPSVIKNFVS